jgi:signal peptidase I
VSPRARRYFGCLLPLALAVTGCGAFAMLVYAGRAAVLVVEAPDAGMVGSQPLIDPGQEIIVNNTAFWAEAPIVGNVVLVGSPDGHTLRRVVGVPGDTLTVRDGRVEVASAAEDPGPCAIGRGPDHGPVTLGPDEYFVMGENRDEPDSRQWGPLPRASIYGLAAFYRRPDGSVDSILVSPCLGRD